VQVIFFGDDEKTGNVTLNEEATAPMEKTKAKI